MSHTPDMAIRSDAEYVLGIHDFEGRSEDELSLKKGDYIEVIETDKAFGDGWYVGRNMRTQKAGLFPKIFTTDLILPKSPTRQASVKGKPTSSAQPQPQQPTSKQGASANNTAPLSAPAANASGSRATPASSGLMEPFMGSRPPQSHHTQNQNFKYSVHDTLTDIDAAISEINAGTGTGGGVYNSSANMMHASASSPDNSSYRAYNSQPNNAYRESQLSKPRSNSASVGHQSSLMPSAVNVTEWSPFDVRTYFLSRGYTPDVAERFVEHKITGPILLELDLAFLKEIGIHTFGTRFEISREIKHLNSVSQRNTSTPISTPPPATYGNKYTPNGSSHTSEYHSPHSTIDSVTEMPPSNTFTPRTTSLGKLATTSPHISSPPHKNTVSNADGVEIVATDRSVTSPTTNAPTYHKRDSSFNKDWTHPRTLSAEISANDSGLSSTGPTDSGYGPSISNQKSAANYVTVDDSLSDTSEQARNSTKSGEILTTSSSGLMHSALRGPMSPKKSESHSRAPSRDTVKEGSDRPYLPFYNLGGKHTRSTSSIALGNHLTSGGHSRGQSDQSVKQHRRHSSILSFMRTDEKDEIFGTVPVDSPDLDGSKGRKNFLGIRTREKRSATVVNGSAPKLNSSTSFSGLNNRSTSSNSAPKKLSKQKTSAFTEGIQTITAAESAKAASHSGWLYKKGGGASAIGTWKNRYFTLHGTRLSYFGNLNDSKERGLIDITAHKVLAARDNEDKLIGIYAASVGAGRHCFKLVPPAPGYRKGVTFTAPKVHYFAVESKQEMKEWMAALMKATIDRDDSVPVESTFASPTVPLPKAQELFAEARARDEDLRAKMVAGGLYNQRLGKTNSPSLANQSPAFPISTPIDEKTPTFPVPPMAHPISTDPRAVNHGVNPSQLKQPQKTSGFYSNTPDSPTGSSMGSSRTGSSATNTSSVKVNSSTTVGHDGDDRVADELHHLTAKTAGLRVDTNI